MLSYIEENKFSNNYKLPSENVISRRLKTSRETVRKALDKLVKEGLVYKIQGSGTYFNKEIALTHNFENSNAQLKIGLILQGHDKNANFTLINGIKSILKPDIVDLKIFLTDNKFSNERKCLQTVINQDFNGFIVDGVKASLLNPNLDCYEELYNKKIPVIFYNNYYKILKYPHIITDDILCASQLIKLIVNSGHKHIAGVFLYDNYQSIEKFRGMLMSMRENFVEFHDDYIKWCISNEAHEKTFSSSIKKFLKGLSNCTIIVCCNYMIYKLVKNVIASNEDFFHYSIVCFDYSGKNYREEGVTCSVHQGYKIGCQSAIQLMKMIKRKDYEFVDYSLVLRPNIFIGNSIKNINNINPPIR